MREHQKIRSSESRGIHRERLLCWVFVLRITQGKKSKAHTTNRLWAQVRTGPSTLSLVCTIGIVCGNLLQSCGSTETHSREMSEGHSGSYVESAFGGSSRGSTWWERRHKRHEDRDREWEEERSSLGEGLYQTHPTILWHNNIYFYLVILTEDFFLQWLPNWFINKPFHPWFFCFSQSLLPRITKIEIFFNWNDFLILRL